MQGKFAVFVDDGVARVVAALIPADDIIVACDEVDHPALALVAPVDAYDCTICHRYCLLTWCKKASFFKQQLIIGAPGP